MAKRKIKKYARRRSSSPYKKSKAPAVVAVLAFLILSFVISVGIGLILGRKAENIKTGDKLDFEVTDYDSDGKKVSPVEAYHFPLGASPYDYVSQTINDLSVCVSHRDGTVDYSLDIADKYNSDKSGSHSFESLCSNASKAGARVCAYVYIRSFECENEYEREIMKAYEIALINELALYGADDILLLGISVTDENIAEVEAFVARAATAAENAPLGVALSLDIIALAKEESYLAARVRSSCDYLALDLTHLTVSDGESLGADEDGNPIPSLLEEILTEYRYYIKSYPMRILFSRSESKLYIPALELGVNNLQIICE